MKRNFIFAMVLLAVITSCGRRSTSGEPNQTYCGIQILDDTYAYFCTPENLTFCKPLAIVNTGDGWIARYGGSEASDSLKLQPVVEYDANGDTVLGFIEFYDGKRNGKYLFINEDYSLDESCSRLKYVKDGSLDTFLFQCTSIKRCQTDINPRKTIKKLGYSYDYHLHHYNDIAMWTLYNIYTRPEATLGEGIFIDDEVGSVVSEDKKVRIYSIYYMLTGNGHGNSVDFITLQYENGDGGISCIPRFSDYVLDYVYETGKFTPNFEHANDFEIFVATLGGKKYYLVETTWYDEAPHHIGNTYYSQQYVVSLAAFSINNGKFVAENIFSGAPVIVRVADSVTVDMHFKYDNITKTVNIPCVDTTNYIFSGTYKEFVLKE